MPHKGIIGALQPPRDESDVPRFLEEVSRHPDFVEVNDRLSAFLGEDDDQTKLMFWSIERYKVGGGRWSNGRRKKHREIIRRLLNPLSVPKDHERSQAVILIGPPGAGKTKVGVPIAMSLGVEFTVINADDVKAMLPEYDGWNAGLLHEESTWLAEELIYCLAVTGRRHLLLDLTGTNRDKIAQMAEDLADETYDVHVIFVDLPAWKSMARAWSRFQNNPFSRLSNEEPGRFVPPDYIYNFVDGKPAITYEYLKKMPRVKSWKRINNDVSLNEKPILVEQGAR